MVKISSKNQQGGITAQNVNTTIHNHEQGKFSLKQIVLFIASVISFIAAVLGILQYFGFSIF